MPVHSRQVQFSHLGANVAVGKCLGANVAQSSGCSKRGRGKIEILFSTVCSEGWQSASWAGGEITASTSWDSSTLPQNLNKPSGNPWHDKGNGKNQWLKFEFPNPINIKGIRTKAPSGWDGSAFKNYELQISENGNDWNTVKTGQGINQDCCSWQEIDFPQSTAKFFRLYMKDNWGYGWIAIQEMQFNVLTCGGEFVEFVEKQASGMPVGNTTIKWHDKRQFTKKQVIKSNTF